MASPYGSLLFTVVSVNTMKPLGPSAEAFRHKKIQAEPVGVPFAFLPCHHNFEVLPVGRVLVSLLTVREAITRGKDSCRAPGVEIALCCVTS